MKDSPKVSVVITAYNVGQYIERAVESSLSQDYDGEMHIVVVDDGSTDATGAVLDTLKDKVQISRQSNVGFIEAVNRGLSLCEGEFVALLDGDDTWPADRIGKQVAFLREHDDVGLVHGDMRVIDEEDNVIENSFFASMGINATRGDVFGRLFHGNFISGGAALFRSSLLPRIHPIPAGEVGAAWPDWWIATRVAEVARIDHQLQPTNNYRRHGANMGFGATGDALAKSKRSEIRFRRWLLAHLNFSRVPLQDLATTFRLLELQTAEIASLTSGRPSEIVEVTPKNRAEALEAFDRGMRASKDGNTEICARLFLRSLGLDPSFGRARAELVFSLELLEKSRIPPLSLPSLDEMMNRHRMLETRRSVIAISIEEQIESPQLLAEAIQALRGNGETTFIVRASALTDSEATLVLQQTLAAVGISLEEDAADILLLTGESAARVEARLDLEVDALLSNRAPEPHLRHIPVFKSGEGQNLKAFVSELS